MNLEAPQATIEIAVAGFELAGAVVITLGSAWARARVAFTQIWSGPSLRKRSLRQALGSAIALSPEFLAAADGKRSSRNSHCKT